MEIRMSEKVTGKRDAYPTAMGGRMSQEGHRGTSDVPRPTWNNDLRRRRSPSSQARLLENNDLRRRGSISVANVPQKCPYAACGHVSALEYLEPVTSRMRSMHDPPDEIEQPRPTTRGAFLRSLGVIALTTFFGGGIPLAGSVRSFWSWERTYRRRDDRDWAGNTAASEVDVGRFWGPFLVGAPIGALVGFWIVWRKSFFCGRRYEWEEGDRHVIPD